MLVDELYDEKFDSIADPNFLQTIDLLKAAITDWPTDVRTVEAFIQEVREFLNCSTITIDVVDRKLSNVNLSEAWRLEALTSVRELMAINQNTPLEITLKGILLLMS
ncbi:MAG: hypothetical protein V4649_02320 [Bacteroidota bacterium]